MSPALNPADTIPCVGCGAAVEATAGPIHRYMTAAPACWAMYGKLVALLLSNPGAAAYRQLCVDAYAVQHPGEPNEQAIQSVAGHLLSLYSTLVLERPIDKASGVISRVVRRKGRYRWLPPPSGYAMTVADMLGNRRRLDEAAHEWAGAAWRAWHPHYGQIKTWYSELFVG